MKKFVVAAVAAVVFCGAPVFAADIPVKTPPAAPVFNWTGFYLGGNVGYGVARDPSSSSLDDPRGLSRPFPETFNVSPRGALGGGQIGYNWQAARNWVLGVEADIQASGQTDSTTCVTACVPTLFTHVAQKLPWFGTLRGRLGWTNGPTLYYVTSGWAFGKVATHYAVDDVSGVDFHQFSRSQSGWTLGGGIETQLVGNWTAKVEYLFVNLGSVAESFVYAPFPASTYAETSAIRNHVVRVGLNYKFGDPVYAATATNNARPVHAAFDWTGFYLGGNLGYGVARNPSQKILTNPGGAPLVTTETFNVSPHGALGGGQIGYNWQAARNWVWGIEADIQASAQTDSTTCVTICFPAFPGETFTRVSQKLPWFGTLRGRLGWTNGPALYYATGGWAIGNVTSDYTVRCCVPGGPTESHIFTHTQSGWTIGGGVETQLAGNWTAKMEYLYINLDNVADSFIHTTVPFVTSYTDTSAIRNHVVRVGLNYKFGTP
jgi:outer membrane immunogenic protein